MIYETPSAFRMALEQRLLTESRATGVSLDRLRRRVIFQRIVARLHTAEPGRWVVKGGMALEIRMGDAARLTKDIDLGLREDATDADALRGRIVEAITVDAAGDGFQFACGPVVAMTEDTGGEVTWRSKIAATLAGKPFGGVQLDVSPRAYELERTDVVALPNALGFAGIETSSVEILDVHRHAAEKFHAMSRRFADRTNSRVRDLVDLVVLVEHDMIDPAALGTHLRQVWFERERETPPGVLPELPGGWASRYDKVAETLTETLFAGAALRAESLWAQALGPSMTG